MKRSTRIWVVIAFFAVAGYAVAQTNLPLTNAPLPGTNAFGNPSPVVSIPLSAIPTWLQLLITPITLALVAAVRKYLPQIKPAYMPFIVPFVGAGLNALIDLIGVWGNQGLITSAVAGAALGGLSTWLHQLGKQGVEIKQSDDTPPTAP
jgi:hypothetical protein